MSLPVPKGASYRDENDKRLRAARSGIIQTNFVIDQGWARGDLDLAAMEELMSSLLAAQLVTLHQQATGQP